MTEQKEFTIEGREESFRPAIMSPVEVLSIASLIGADSFKQNKEVYAFCLENLEVKVAEKWMPVKTKGKEIYWPQGIENDYKALLRLSNHMLYDILIPLFQLSSK